MNKIATILPYKENYTKNNAGAASLWVCDFLKHSKFKKSNTIYGHTIYKNYLTKTIKSSYLTSGPICQEVEGILANKFKKKYALLTNSWTNAVIALLLSLKIKKNIK